MPVHKGTEGLPAHGGEHHSAAGPDIGKPNWSEIVARFEQLIGVSVESTDFYRRLHPDGRELSQRERLEVREQLVKRAVALRRLAQIEAPIAKLLAAEKPPKDLLPVVEGWRRDQRSLVLTLSDSPEVRVRAYPADAPMTREEFAARDATA